MTSLMAEASGKFKRVSCALEEMSQQPWNDDLLAAAKGSREEDGRPAYCTQLFTACRVLSGQRELREMDQEEEVTSSVRQSLIDSLKREWGFVTMFWWLSHFWTKTGKDVQSTGFLISKMEAAEDEINHNLNFDRKKKYALRRPSKLAHFIRESLKSIEQFRQEAEATLHCFQPSESIRLKTSWSFYSHYPLKCFICSVEENLEVISTRVDSDPVLAEKLHAFRKQVTSLRLFLSEVTSFYYIPHNRNWRIKDFLHHVASITVQAAYYSCIYWFRQMNPKVVVSAISGILDLQQQIDPSDSKFLELNLKFLKDLKLMTLYGAADYKTTFFLDHLFGLKHETSHRHGGLMTLVSYVLHHQEESIEKDEYRMADIMAVLREALPLRDVLFISLSSCEVHKAKLWYLEQKILLLKIEIFLEHQVGSSTMFSLDTADQIKALSKWMEMLRTSCRDTLRAQFKNENQALIVMEEVVGEIECLYQSFQAEKMTESKIRNLLSMMLLRILLSKAGRYLLDLLTCSASSAAFGKDQIEALHNRLKLLSLIVKHHPVKDVKPNLSQFEEVARGIISLYHTFLAKKLAKEMIQMSISSFSDLLDKMTQPEFDQWLVSLSDQEEVDADPQGSQEEPVLDPMVPRAGSSGRSKWPILVSYDSDPAPEPVPWALDPASEPVTWASTRS